MLNLVCVRTGDLYGPEYVEILFDMLLRNSTQYEGELKLWCVTDQPETLPEPVIAIPADPTLKGFWQKVRLFSPDMPWGVDERVVYFDLDVAITGRLEDLLEYEGAIIQDWYYDAFNSSVMTWRHGQFREVWERFDPCIMEDPRIGGDQDWITTCARTGGRMWDTFPKAWCVSYKGHAKKWPPDGSKVVVFHGEPKPADVKGWVENVWKLGGFTSLPKMGGVNVSHETIWANVEANVRRKLPWFVGNLPSRNTMVLVCGGPSLNDTIQDIKWHKRHGAKVVTVNNTLKVMLENGINPDAHVMLDARPENVEFIQGIDAKVRYFIASQVDPVVFDALYDQDVVLWHNAVGDGERLEEIAKPFESDAEERALLQVPGGGTVGLRAMFLGFFSGYRKLHIYGMDGSYKDGRHHAYPQALNDGEDTLTVQMGEKQYQCAKWMARQATEFKGQYEELTRMGMQIFVHGSGLIPDMARALRQEARVAA
jgi:hypothetical protein